MSALTQLAAETEELALSVATEMNLRLKKDFSNVASQSGARTALGLGTAATQNTGTSGATVPLLNGANAWSGAQTYGSTLRNTGGVANPATSNVAGWNIDSTGILILSASNINALGINRTNDGAAATWFRGGVSVGSISVTTTATAYNTSSDYRLKENIEPLTGALDRLALLKPSRFSFKSDPAAGLFDGFIAHEVDEVVPQAVTGVKDGPEMQAIDASKLIPLLTAALQELTARVEALEA